jgi:hypothetical protein
MQKFRIHAFHKVRQVFVVEAESIDLAISMIDDVLYTQDPVEQEYTNEFDTVCCVDPMLPDGEVDYANSRWVGEE